MVSSGAWKGVQRGVPLKGRELGAFGLGIDLVPYSILGGSIFLIPVMKKLPPSVVSDSGLLMRDLSALQHRADTLGQEKVIDTVTNHLYLTPINQPGHKKTFVTSVHSTISGAKCYAVLPVLRLVIHGTNNNSRCFHVSDFPINSPVYHKEEGKNIQCRKKLQQCERLQP